MNALAHDFMTGSDFTNFWKADFILVSNILEVESQPCRHVQKATH